MAQFNRRKRSTALLDYPTALILGLAFDHLAALMNPGAAIFGTTILGKGETPNLMARKLMSFYNDKQVFSNLERALRDRFSGVSLELVGEEALFSARLA